MRYKKRTRLVLVSIKSYSLKKTYSSITLYAYKKNLLLTKNVHVDYIVLVKQIRMRRKKRKRCKKRSRQLNRTR